jgi:hypothetical protein
VPRDLASAVASPLDAIFTPLSALLKRFNDPKKGQNWCEDEE